MSPGADMDHAQSRLGVAQLSQDRFWEQWGQQEPAPGAGSPPAAPGPDRGADLGNLNFDALSAWLSDSPAPAVTAPPSPSPTASPATVDLSGVWPSSATADPFAAILSPGAAPTPAPPGGSNWDLVIEPTPSRAAPPASPSFGAAPGPDPFLNPPAGVYGSTSAAPAGYGAPPAASQGFMGAPPTPAPNPIAPPVPTPTFGLSPTPAGVIDLGPLGPDPAFDLAGLGGAPLPAAPVYPTAAIPPPVSAPIASPYAGGAGSGGGGFGVYPGSPYAGPAAHPPLASETIIGIRPTVPALLKVEISSGARTVEKEIQGEALIGRPDAARGVFPQIDLRLDDAVSRRHARIYEKEGRFYLMDLNSTNGTRYNQQFLDPETPVPLLVGDQIEVGETVIRVLASPGVSA